MLFSMMLTHGVAPQGLLLTTLVPIYLKIREAINVTINYRQNTISNLPGKNIRHYYFR